jgi:phosphoenolpyruvate---glycerone phosphotransferase subunit DhaL
VSESVDGAAVQAAVLRIADRLAGLEEELNALDAAVGDGDLGITAAKAAGGLRAYVSSNPPGADLGKYLAGLGMAYNKAAPSTMGGLLATGLMRAGKEGRNLASLDAPLIARMLRAADVAIQERGGAKPGDKTVVDVLHPAAEAFAAAAEGGLGLAEAGQALLQAARAGRDAAVPLRSKAGRSSWVGERTENKRDPGCELLLNVFEAALG